MEKRKKHQNVKCSLITSEENDKLLGILGLKCFTIASAVVQVFLTEAPDHSNWIKKFCGVACFIKDFIRKSYYIRIFDMGKFSCVWEQELYNQFCYLTPRPFYHTFEADNSLAGLNFASNGEAFDFSSAIQNMIKMRHERRLEKKRNNLLPSQAGIVVATRASSESSLVAKDSKHRDKKKIKKKKLTKEDIGKPTNFIHHQHVGWDPLTGYDLNVEDPTLKGFFNLAGVSDVDLKDNETRKFIYDFLDDHGGVEAAKQEVIERSSSPPRAPLREAPPTPRAPHGSPSLRTAAPLPPPPPSVPPAMNRQNVHRGSGVAPSHGKVPPRPKPPSAVQATAQVPSNAVVPPPAPPPPPPLPSPATNNSAPPPPPPLPSMMGNVNSGGPPDSRSAFLDQIRKGKMLNHVEPESNHTPASTDDARGALLNQIRRGIELKPVEEQKSTPKQMHGLAEALAKALKDRNQAIHHTDESDSGDEDEDNDDDEWED